MTSVSRVLGFIRDLVIAQSFGAGAAADAFFVAFRIPNFLRRMFAEGAFSQAFVPVLAEYRTQRPREDTRALLDRIAGTLSLVLALITVLGILAAPILIALFAPGFIASPHQFALSIGLLRITFPYILFISLVAFAAGILQTYGRFAVPAFTPSLLNLCMIAASLWLAPYCEQPIDALAWGVFAGGAAQLLFQLPFLARLGLLPLPKIDWRDPGVRRVLRLMGPALLGVSVVQVNLLVNTLVASFLPAGSVSWIYYSDRLLEFPLGVFGVALSTVILPGLSQQHAAGAAEDFSRMLDWGLRWVFLIALPASLALILLAGPVLCTLFQYGEFSAHDVEMTRRSLMTYSFGLLAFVLVKVLAPGFYARQDIRTPVRVAVQAMLANLVLIAVLVGPLAHAGLMLATALAGWVNALLLFIGLRGIGVYRASPGWAVFLLRVVVANLAMTALILFATPALEDWLAWGAGARSWRLGALIGASGLLYVGALWLLGLRGRHITALRSPV